MPVKNLSCLTILISSFLFVNYTSFGQVWEKSYTTYHNIYDAQECYDKGIMFGANIDYTNEHGALVKTDVNGTILWYKYFQDSIYAGSIKCAKDGGVLVGGFNYKINNDGNPFIMKMDASMNVLWAENFDCNGVIGGVKERPNGDVLVQIEVYDASNTGWPELIYCLDKTGKEKWKYWTYSLLNLKYTKDIDFNKDGSMYLTGYYYIPGVNSTVYEVHPLEIKLDSSGRQIWSKLYGVSQGHIGDGWMGLVTPDKGIIEASVIDYDSNYFIKYDSNGENEWTKYAVDLKTPEIMQDGQSISNNSYILLYDKHSEFVADDYLRLYKIDVNANVLNKKDYIRKDKTAPLSMNKMSGNAFLIAAYSFDSTKNKSYGYLMKVDTNLANAYFDTKTKYKYDTLSSKKITSGDTIYFPKNARIVQVDSSFYTGANIDSKPNLDIHIFPNPFTQETNISYTIGKRAIVKIDVLDMLGNSLGILRNEEQSAGSYSLVFNSANYPVNKSGIYLARITIGTTTGVYKLILSR